MTKRQTDIAKGIAILCMIFHHLFNKPARYEAYGLTGLIVNQNLTVSVANALKVCVAIFAFVSGYGMTMKARAAEKEQGRMTLAWHSGNMIRSYYRLIKDTCFLMIITVPISEIFQLSRRPVDVWCFKGIPEAGKIIAGFLSNMTGTAGFFGYNWFIRPWWYLKIAVLFILLFPLLYTILRQMKKTGWFLLLLISILVVPCLLGINVKRDRLWRYLPAFISGMIIAEKGIIDKLSEWKSGRTQRAFILGTLLIVLLSISLLIGGIISGIQYVTQSVQALSVCVFSALFLSRLRTISSVLALLGENSKYMWLIHSYLYGQLIMDFLFSMRNIWVIYVFLTVQTLVISIVLHKLCNWLFSLGIRHNTEI